MMSFLNIYDKFPVDIWWVSWRYWLVSWR